MQVLNWQDIIEKHGESVWKTSYRLLRNHQDAADCFQETFMAALEISKRQKIKNLHALLSRLATNRAIDKLRLIIRANNVQIPHQNMDSIQSNNISPDKKLQTNELASHLRSALAQIPSNEAKAFCLRYLNDFSYKQIAEELNITITATGTMLHRAKDKLRQILKANPVNIDEVTL